MKPFSRILVPVDFQPHSAEAVHQAMKLAAPHSTQLVLLHVDTPADDPKPGDIVYRPRQLTRRTDDALARLEAVRRDIDPSGRCVSTRMLRGAPARSIIDVAAQEACDLIVMGTHGRTGIERIVLGSVAEQVVRGAPCAVLTVKSPRPFRAAQRRADPALPHA